MLALSGSIPDQDESADDDVVDKEPDCGCPHRKNKDRRGKPELDEKPKHESFALGLKSFGVLGKPAKTGVPGRRTAGKNRARHPRGRSRVESFHVRNALQTVCDVMESGEGSLREAVERLTLSLYEAGLGPIRHFNQKTGECSVPSEMLQTAMERAHRLSLGAHLSEEHRQASDAHTLAANGLMAAGFQQLGSLHAQRAQQHKRTSAY